MKMVLNRDYFLASTCGHSVQFTANEPVTVPYAMVPEAQQIGALPVDGETVKPKEEKVPREPQGEARAMAILDAVRKIKDRNNPDHFTAGGAPNLKAVKGILGFEPSRAEINKAFSGVMTGGKEDGT